MKLFRPGLLPYGQALALQLSLRAKLQEEEADESIGYLLLVEHPPVVTLGKRGRLEDLFGLQDLKERGTEIFRIDRGGEATYHGPGQLVIYPVLRLNSIGLGVVDLIRGMAASLAETLEEYGVKAKYDCDHPGLWTVDTPARKIASVGMRVSGGVTTHGAALNLTNDLTPFSLFVPCGMPGAPLTRLQDYQENPVDIAAFSDRFLVHFARFLEVEFQEITLALPPEDQWVAPLEI